MARPSSRSNPRRFGTPSKKSVSAAACRSSIRASALATWLLSRRISDFASDLAPDLASDLATDLVLAFAAGRFLAVAGGRTRALPGDAGLRRLAVRKANPLVFFIGYP